MDDRYDLFQGGRAGERQFEAVHRHAPQARRMRQRLDPAGRFAVGDGPQEVVVGEESLRDWRWLREGRDSPWYPTVQIFRQRERGDWRGVVREMETALRERLHLS